MFFATAYHLLNPDYHDWMGVFAIGMALIYAGTLKLLLDRKATTEWEMLAMIGVALTFVTIAIPIQLKAKLDHDCLVRSGAHDDLGGHTNEISASSCFRLCAIHIGGRQVVALGYDYRPRDIHPGGEQVFSFLARCDRMSILGVRLAPQLESTAYMPLSENIYIIILMIAIGTLWWVLSAETFSFFQAKAAALKEYEDERHQLWLGQMALSVLWSVYAAVLAAVGFVRRSPPVRWAALGVFGLTVLKVMLVDIAQLRQLYRIVAFLVLGLILLVVAWGYHKAFRRKETQS